jgi:hypothetical protein
MFNLKSLAAAVVAACLPFALLAQPAAPKPVIMPGPAPDYARSDHWLCRPENMTACATRLDATVIAADRGLAVKPWRPAARPSIDCFYVYPTASFDPASNSDLIPGPSEEIAIARAQFARFAGVCRPFAPMYRSRTATALRGQMPPGDGEMAYADVAAAWAYYLAHDNHGRGVVLVGHSQGSSILRRLIAQSIDGRPEQKLLVAALLAGTNLGVPPGGDVGGEFKSIPLCRKLGQTGCVIAWNSYRRTTPPPSNAVLGGPRKDGLVNACVNPASLAGGEAPLDAYLRTTWDAGKPIAWTTPARPIDTDFVQVPGLLMGECLSDSNGSYLAVAVRPDPAPARVQDFRGDVVGADGKVMHEWGLHMLDVDLVMGDLLHVVSEQAKAWGRSHADNR